MIIPSRREAVHKAWLFRLLRAIYDEQFLISVLYFKGGTCASMRDLLDRFSVDLDFDYVGREDELTKTRNILEAVFTDLGLIIKDQSKSVPQYFLQYPRTKNTLRNTIKIDVTFPPPQANKYTAVRLTEIDRIIYCQTTETMFANKLVALIERYEKNGSIAGRDLYDVHHFFLQGFDYEANVIKERRNEDSLVSFFRELHDFVDQKINQKTIDQDINFLLPPDKFRRVRKTLRQEVLMFLADEIEKVG